MLYILLFIIFYSINASEFDWDTGNTSVMLSLATYCDKSTYMSNNYNTPFTFSFVPTFQIYNKEYDIDGFIGYRPADSTIYVVYRGTQSTQDWIDDFQFKKINYDELSCQVHKGFYEGEQSVITEVLTEVYNLHELYPTYRIVVTGHSLGAALATLTAYDIVQSGLNVQLINFGCPRIFDKACAKYASNIINKIVRVTHYKDIVPHVPLMSMDYYHTYGEWYEDDNHNIKECDGYEDKTCADQWRKTDTQDHSWYLGFYMSCDTLEQYQIKLL